MPALALNPNVADQFLNGVLGCIRVDGRVGILRSKMSRHVTRTSINTRTGPRTVSRDFRRDP